MSFGKKGTKTMDSHINDKVCSPKSQEYLSPWQNASRPMHTFSPGTRYSDKINRIEPKIYIHIKKKEKMKRAITE